ncbi:hypothetical protein ES705_08164 [subsurface metagenome]
MAILSEEEIRKDAIYEVAKQMMIAARTAPKGRGADNMVITCADGEIITAISKRMIELARKNDWPSFFNRDAENILHSPYMILIGTKISPLRLKVCGMCGYENCDEKDKHPDIPCVFNSGDLGIAIGSAVSVAMDHRVDNRIMYTVGQAVKEMKLLDEDVKIIYGIPLSVSGKNPFFDRKHT